MKTIGEVSALSGVSVRTLHHYDAIGLLPPSQVTESGYRLYDDAALERLQMILLFRELEFPLADIGRILAAPDFDRALALEQHEQLLKRKRERLDGLISFVRDIQKRGVSHMNFDAFDTKTIDEYTAQAKAAWGKTEAWQEFEQKSAVRGKPQETALADGLMDFFRRLGELRDQPPEAPQVQAVLAGLQAYITEHYYNCTPQIFRGLGELYAAPGSMHDNIDKTGGAGTAELAKKGIDCLCGEA